MNTSAWISAFRLRTLPLSVAGIITGTAVALHDGFFNPVLFPLAIATALLLQILSNLANDYGDFKNGADNMNRIGPQRAVQSGAITPGEMKTGIFIFSLLAFASGISLLYFAFRSFEPRFLIFLLLGVLSIGAALKYTMGKNPYGYSGLGDIAVFIFFGLVSVCGSYFLYAGNLKWYVFYLR